ncbi:hypothetical protein [Nocardiopsis algeriensis]|uniref:Uncharacterized protein n=1 Tax=Nocardiopsis algeriensis TaxID=1478215 RepID=A0A841IPT4_9ACTN|nr:hypothetical protein [Nocardiopsis algeriensis]MBB6120683.1 hypothetical protein [Nocardiopsis algeriensis]
MSAVKGYSLRPSETVVRLRKEFPHFLICELSGEQGRSYFIATSDPATAGGRPQLIVREGAEELRQALSVLGGGAA